MQLKTGLKRLVTHHRRHRFNKDLGQMGPGELATLAQMARLWKQWPRRWWWVDEWQEVHVIGP